MASGKPLVPVRSPVRMGLVEPSSTIDLMSRGGPTKAGESRARVPSDLAGASGLRPDRAVSLRPSFRLEIHDAVKWRG